ncbi:VOC family protein [bacterium]|nr:VOC family protein [bacterium]
MKPTDVAIPVLPCRSLDETLHFYSHLGFYIDFRQDAPDPYAILHRGRLELHVFVLPGLDPATSYTNCYLRVGDVNELATMWADAKLPAHGIPRMTAVEDKPWGMREFAVVDPNGNLLRAGQPIAAARGL